MGWVFLQLAKTEHHWALGSGCISHGKSVGEKGRNSMREAGCMDLDAPMENIEE